MNLFDRLGKYLVILNPEEELDSIISCFFIKQNVHTLTLMYFRRRMCGIFIIIIMT